MISWGMVNCFNTFEIVWVILKNCKKVNEHLKVVWTDCTVLYMYGAFSTKNSSITDYVKYWPHL